MARNFWTADCCFNCMHRWHSDSKGKMVSCRLGNEFWYHNGRLCCEHYARTTNGHILGKERRMVREAERGD